MGYMIMLNVCKIHLNYIKVYFKTKNYITNIHVSHIVMSY